MNTDRLRDEVIRAIRDVQERSGRACETLEDHDKPIGALDGFDSLNALEVTVDLESRLGLDLHGQNLLINDEGTRALSIAEVVARIAEHQSASTEQENTDAA